MMGCHCMRPLPDGLLLTLVIGPWNCRSIPAPEVSLLVCREESTPPPPSRRCNVRSGTGYPFPWLTIKIRLEYLTKRS
ncbi:hypothetical protein BDV32DRAFT_5836 [Aspergillus pseudonomiae]|nr:hypothetical protein BDV32DRAFT_5836 [Aspergillus pseudonomiae]